jgi:hypothetical protein
MKHIQEIVAILLLVLAVLVLDIANQLRGIARNLDDLPTTEDFLDARRGTSGVKVQDLIERRPAVRVHHIEADTLIGKVKQ